MKPEEYRLVMRNLEVHYQDFMRDSQDSQLFSPDDRMQVEDDYNKVSQHFENLLRSMERGKTSFTESNCDFFFKEKQELKKRERERKPNKK